MSNINSTSITEIVDPFDILRIQNCTDFLEIKIPTLLRDKNWANGIGQIQSSILLWAAQHSDTAKNKAIIDFYLCRWIDPLPLLSLLLEIANARHLGMTIDVLLPDPDSGPHPLEIGPYQRSANRFLRFLDQEGFLDCLEGIGGIGIHYFMADQIYGRAFIKNIMVKPSYEDARCIPVCLFNVPKECDDNKFAKKTVESLLLGVDSKLESKISPHTRERLIYKLRVALQEVLHNAQEHAYENNETSRFISIYVRYRTGSLGLDFTAKKIYKSHVDEERKHCPMLAEDWLSARPGCLELFVLDRGVGMVHRFEQAEIPLTEKYKFNQIMKETFLGGRSSKPERQTLYGGLHLLYNLLADTGDFLRALEGSVWFASNAPLDRSSAKTYLLTDNQAKFNGLAMHMRFGWKEETDYGSKWANFALGDQSELWPELCLNESDAASSFKWFENQRIIDERFGERKEYGNSGDWILWLVRPHRMKWDILHFLENHVATKATENTILIIADIPSYEAETYAAALAEFKALGTTDWPSKFSKVILSTNRWRFAAVSYQEHFKRHGFTSLYENFNEIQIKPPPIEPKPKNFRLAIVRWLKWHDSRRLWEEVSLLRSTFIAEPITWGYDETGSIKKIQGYLNFPQTTHNGLCESIYRTALARILGVLPPDKIELHPLDRLIMPVLREIHIAEVYEPAVRAPNLKLALGSVLVSGATLGSSASLPLSLHFFIHQSSPSRGLKPSLLFWLPKTQVKEGVPKFARIGKTAVIAPEGWKSFEVPRFDSNEKCFGANDPEKTYQDWQNSSPVIVKAGHWSYEGHHDFITLNIASAVESAFLEKNELARFLVSYILPFIGITKEHITVNSQRLLNEQSTNIKNIVQDKDNYGLLIYRSHPSSEAVIRKLLSLLTTAGLQLALSRIFPILPIRTRWSGSTLLIPPLVREDIELALKNGENNRNILLFDDAAITGRTLYDLRAALSAIGANKIKTMVIVNRLRQPADGFGEQWVDYFWRLDVPVMGREGNCPLCHALHLAETLTSSLVVKNAREEIKGWRILWGETSPLDNWSSGLRPLTLSATEQKKYCYRQIKSATNVKDKYLSKIELIKSTGLAIHVAELHAMTGRDDYCLKKIKEHLEPEIRIELAASQILLFGDEFDEDIRIELVQSLIRELSKLKKDSPHAPLAVIAAMAGLVLLSHDAKLKTAQTVLEDGWVVRNNYTAKVLLAYLVSEKLISSGNVAFEIGVRLLSTASLPLAQRFSAWFLEILSPRGNAHSEAIPVLMDELTNDLEAKDFLIMDALDSLDRLSELVDGLGRSMVRKGAAGEYGIMIEKMQTDSEVSRCLLTSKLSQGISEGWVGKTKSALETYIETIKSIADAYFHRVLSTQDYWRVRTFETKELIPIISTIKWESACESKSVESRNRLVKISHTGEIGFDCNSGEVWIPWHRGIAAIVLDLLRNAVYSNGQIPDPWYADQQDKADLWVRVNYGKEGIELILANASKYGHQEIFSNLKKHRWFPLLELGGRVDSKDIAQNVVGIRVSIPYAAYLNS